jgi:hypothetical protein
VQFWRPDIKKSIYLWLIELKIIIVQFKKGNSVELLMIKKSDLIYASFHEQFGSFAIRGNYLRLGKKA